MNQFVLSDSLFFVYTGALRMSFYSDVAVRGTTLEVENGTIATAASATERCESRPIVSNS